MARRTLTATVSVEARWWDGPCPCEHGCDRYGVLEIFLYGRGGGFKAHTQDAQVEGPGTSDAVCAVVDWVESQGSTGFTLRDKDYCGRAELQPVYTYSNGVWTNSAGKPVDEWGLDLFRH